MKVIVLLSGGLDSTVAVAHAIAAQHSVEALSLDYGQTHRQELKAAQCVAEHYGIAHRVIDIRATLTSCALTGHGEIPNEHASSPDATFIPGRNLIMLSVAIGLAQSAGAGAVVLGANADDHAGYPDCRPEFVDAADKTARISTAGQVGVWAPFVRMTKRQIVKRGITLHAPLSLTYSCYRGGVDPCGRCGACESRDQAMAAT